MMHKQRETSREDRECAEEIRRVQAERYPAGTNLEQERRPGIRGKARDEHDEHED